MNNKATESIIRLFEEIEPLRQRALCALPTPPTELTVRDWVYANWTQMFNPGVVNAAIMIRWLDSADFELIAHKLYAMDD